MLIVLAVAAGGNVSTAAAQAVTYAGSGAVNFGTANVCPSGKTVPAPCSQTLTLTYDVTASGTLGSPKALTVGAPNLDYTVASGSTCSGSVAKGNTCKVNIAFAPTQPGGRDGAVEIVDSSGNALATTFIYGIGAGPRIGFTPAAARTIGGSLLSPGVVAVDGNGNLFITAEAANTLNPVLEELLAVGGSVPANPVVKVLLDNFQGYLAVPTSVAVDGAGNVFFTVSSYTGSSGADGYVGELLAADGYSTPVTLAQLGGANGIAVDGSGNVFASNTFFSEASGVVGGIYELPAAGGYSNLKALASQTTLIPASIALDSKGNLFVANAAVSSTPNVFEFGPSDGYAAGRAINIPSPYAMALDPAGNLFAALPLSFAEYLAVDGVLPANPASQPVEYRQAAGGLALDSGGNLFDTNFVPNGRGSAQLQQLQLATQFAVDYEQTVVGKTSSDSPRSVAIQNEGTAPLDLTGLSLDNSNWDLVKGSGTPEDCAAGISLLPGAVCNLSISFEPTDAGQLSGAITLTDNSLNAPGAQQPILLEGYGDSFPPPRITGLNINYGAPYSVVFIKGNNFGTGKGSNTVTFNGIAAPVYFPSSTSLVATVPGKAALGANNLVVQVNGESSDPVAFTVLPMPVVTGISPTSGSAGTIVTISGKNLLGYNNNGTVEFNGQPLSILLESSTEVQVEVPAGAVTGRFHVLINDTGMNTPIFTVTK